MRAVEIETNAGFYAAINTQSVSRTKAESVSANESVSSSTFNLQINSKSSTSHIAEQNGVQFCPMVLTRDVFI